MAEGYKDFVTGAVLTAGDLEDYCERQGILRFASAAARDTALAPILTEGLMAYLKDANTITTYNGSTGWSTTGPIFGALNPWSPTITQSGSVTYSGSYGSYSRAGRDVRARCRLDVTGTGTASNMVTVSLPVAAVSTGDVVIGAGYLFDTSAAIVVKTIVATVSGGTTAYMLNAASSNSFALTALGSGANSGFVAGLASGDIISMAISYEAAADA